MSCQGDRGEFVTMDFQVQIGQIRYKLVSEAARNQKKMKEKINNTSNYTENGRTT